MVWLGQVLVDDSGWFHGMEGMGDAEEDRFSAGFCLRLVPSLRGALSALDRCPFVPKVPQNSSLMGTHFAQKCLGTA